MKNIKSIKKFIVDSTTNIIYWHPLFAFLEFFILKLTIPELLSARFGNLIFAIIMGGVYGKAIDGGRYLLNKKYYDETINGIKRKTTNWKTELQDAIVDMTTTSIYWGIIMSCWLHFVTGFSWEKTGTIIISYTIIQIIFSGFYGKVLNWSRRKFKV